MAVSKAKRPTNENPTGLRGLTAITIAVRGKINRPPALLESSAHAREQIQSTRQIPTFEISSLCLHAEYTAVNTNRFSGASKHPRRIPFRKRKTHDPERVSTASAAPDLEIPILRASEYVTQKIPNPQVALKSR